MSSYFYETKKPGLVVDAGHMGNHTRCLLGVLFLFLITNIVNYQKLFIAQKKKITLSQNKYVIMFLKI